jgi:hypothetical protein
LARTTVDLVELVLDRNYDGQMDLQQFIDTANLLVNRVATCASDRGEPLSAEELELIERWLAAHYYAQVDPTYTSKSTDGASASFMGASGKYLEGSRFGQVAITLDPSGCLESIVASGDGGGRKVARAFWLGKAPSEQTDYRDRD